MDRKEAYYNIQQFGYGPELQKKFGKPYSSVSSAELIPAVEEMMKESKAKNEVPKPKKDEAPKPKKEINENPNSEKKKDQVKKEIQEKKEGKVKINFVDVERIKLGRQYADKITELKNRKAYMEKSLEVITTRDDLSIRISSGGGISYYTFNKNGGLEYNWSSNWGFNCYPNFVTSMYYYSKERSKDTLGVFSLSELISNEDNIKKIKNEYISLYKELISDIDELIKECEIKFAEL